VTRLRTQSDGSRRRAFDVARPWLLATSVLSLLVLAAALADLLVTREPVTAAAAWTFGLSAALGSGSIAALIGWRIVGGIAD
jgi:hypothetical protein